MRLYKVCCSKLCLYFDVRLLYYISHNIQKSSYDYAFICYNPNSHYTLRAQCIYYNIYVPEITKLYFRTFCTFVHCSWVPLDILIRYYSCFSVVVDLLTQLLIRLQSLLYLDCESCSQICCSFTYHCARALQSEHLKVTHSQNVVRTIIDRSSIYSPKSRQGDHQQQCLSFKYVTLS